MNKENNVSRETLEKNKKQNNVSRETLLDKKYMDIAIKEAQKAFKSNEIPVGCVIVKDNKIIVKTHNKREKTNKIVDHAELLAITKANKKLKNWRLEDCIMYVTMEPCMMCCGAIKQSRIKKIVYGCDNKNFGNIQNLTEIKVVKMCEEECKKMVQLFFKNKR